MRFRCTMVLALCVLGCGGDVSLAEITRAPWRFAGRTITTSGRLSPRGIPIPMTDMTLREIVDGRDTLHIIACDTTMLTQRVVVRVQVQYGAFGSFTGPILVAVADTSAQFLSR